MEYSEKDGVWPAGEVLCQVWNFLRMCICVCEGAVVGQDGVRKKGGTYSSGGTVG